MSADTEHWRIVRLEARVGRLERKLNLPPIETEGIVAPAPAPPQARQGESATEEPDRKPVGDRSEPPHAKPRLPVVPVPAPAPEPVQARRGAAGLSGAQGARPVLPYAPTLDTNPAQGALEQTIGLKWAGWIGALVLVIGAGLGIKYAYEHGYFEVLPPAARLLLMSLGGFGLIGAGEWVFRRVNKIAAAGLYAAGVATLFFVSHAGHAYYGLYEPTTAFAMMALTTLVGAAVAMRGKLVSIAVLSLIGGNLAPFVLGVMNLHLAPFLTYLLMLQVVSVTLAWWGRDARWRMLRGLSLASTALWMLPLILRGTGAPPPALVAFALMYAAIYQLELIASAARAGTGDTKLKVRDDVAFSVAVTAALTCGVLMMFRGAGASVQGTWVVGLCAACGFAGTMLSPRRSGETRALGIGFIVQSAALAVLAVPVAFSGVTVSIGWAILALAFAGAGAVLDQRSLRAAASTTWALAVGQFVLWSNFTDATDVTRLVSGWTIAAVGHGLAWLAIVRADSAKPQAAGRIRSARFVAGAAGVVFVLVSIAWLSPLMATIALLAYAWIAAITDKFDARLGYIAHAVALVAVAVVKWVVVDMLADRFAPGWFAAAHRPLLNAHMAAGVLISCSLAGVYWLRRDAWPRMLREGAGGTLAVAAALIMLIGLALSVEIDRVVEQALLAGPIAWPPMQLKHLAWTMLWSAAALACAGAARVIVPEPSRRTGPIGFVTTCMCLLAMKFIFIDTFGYRITHAVADVLPIANVQVMAALFVIGGLVACAALLRRAPDAIPSAGTFIACLVILLVLWMGSFEIDRAFDGMPKQLGLSIFWSVSAVLAVAGGFRLRVAGLRYAGLALFALTLLKVCVIDLSGVRDGYRVLSFMGLGALLLGTSVLYGKLSPKLLEERQVMA